jgi:hypothetical protein
VSSGETSGIPDIQVEARELRPHIAGRKTKNLSLLAGNIGVSGCSPPLLLKPPAPGFVPVLVPLAPQRSHKRDRRCSARLATRRRFSSPPGATCTIPQQGQQPPFLPPSWRSGGKGRGNGHCRGQSLLKLTIDGIKARERLGGDVLGGGSGGPHAVSKRAGPGDGFCAVPESLHAAIGGCAVPLALDERFVAPSEAPREARIEVPAEEIALCDHRGW